MGRISIWVLMVTSLFLLNNINMINCVDEEVKKTLIQFVSKLASNTLDWKPDSDPCKDNWVGVYCDDNDAEIKRLYLNKMNLSGTLDVAMICNSQPLAASLTFLTLDDNNISGEISSEIANCRQLTRLHLGRNQLAGNIPASLATLNNLKRLDISINKFSGPLPDLSRISGLNMFLEFRVYSCTPAKKIHLSPYIKYFLTSPKINLLAFRIISYAKKKKLS